MTNQQGSSKKGSPIYYKYRRICKNRNFFFAFAYLYSWRNFRQKEATLVCKKNLALEQNRHFICNTYSRCVITNKLNLFHMISAI